MNALRTVVLTLSLLSCTESPAAQAGDASGPRAGGLRQETKLTPVEPVYDSGLASEWQDYGWAPRKLDAGAARIDVRDQGGWIIARPGLTGKFGGLVFRFKAPREWGDFLEVRLDGTKGATLPGAVPQPGHVRDLPDGWSEAWLAFEELNPRVLEFDRIVFRVTRPLQGTLLLDKIAFTREAPPFRRAVAEVKPTPARPAKFRIDCRARTHPISPLIFGIAFNARLDASDPHQWDVGATARRWGGNSMSRYNWKLGNAWNTANDWFFQNLNYTSHPDYSYTRFFDDNQARGVMTALQLPIIGWVAKDTSSVSFPRTLNPLQQSFDEWRPEAGNGRSPDGSLLPSGPPERTSVKAPPEFIAEWVKAIRTRDAGKGDRSVQMYILGNEPSLWHETHRDVHPEPLTYDELLEKTIAYGSGVRNADKDAVIAGPGAWGWPEYFYSARDMQSSLLKPDYRAHGSVPLLAWYLRKLREHEKKTGVRILDVLDVHFYPQGQGLFTADGGGVIDEDANARRIRATRALWDPTYKDESWIDEEIMLLPRLKKWIDENYPGTRISIGEWNFGAEQHMSGGIATAEALGRFAEGGVYSAFYWTYPAKNSPAAFAFRAYRNYDGKGGRFLDRYVSSTAEDGTSMFVSRDKSGTKLVAVMLNKDPLRARDAEVGFQGCGAVTGASVFAYDGSADHFAEPRVTAGNGTARLRLEPYSINVLELSIQGD